MSVRTGAGTSTLARASKAAALSDSVTSLIYIKIFGL